MRGHSSESITSNGPAQPAWSDKEELREVTHRMKNRPLLPPGQEKNTTNALVQKVSAQLSSCVSVLQHAFVGRAIFSPQMTGVPRRRLFCYFQRHPTICIALTLKALLSPFGFLSCPPSTKQKKTVKSLYIHQSTRTYI